MLLSWDFIIYLFIAFMYIVLITFKPCQGTSKLCQGVANLNESILTDLKY